MKTLFIFATGVQDDHVGEEYDEVIEVIDEPTTENIDLYADQIRGRIRKMWHEREDDEEIEVTFDAAAPFYAMLVNLFILMPEEEGISFRMPQYSGQFRGTTDKEAQEVLDKLDGR